MTANQDLKLESCPKCNGAAFTRGDGIYCAPAQHHVSAFAAQSGDVADEAKFEELLHAYKLAITADGSYNPKPLEALRSFFKRAAKGGEGMVSVPRDALETLVETAVVVGERAQTRYQWAKAIVISALSTNQP